MKPIILGIAATALVVCLAWSQQTSTDVVWAPKTKPFPYTAPHKPITKLADVKAAHAKEKSWRHQVVKDEHLSSEWIQDLPGTKAPRQLHPDTREWWVIHEGQMRFEIEGQQPIIASKGSMVQVPMQTFFSYETIGDKPSLRFQTNVVNARTLYAKDQDPKSLPKMEAYDYIPVRVGRRVGYYDHGNKPHVTYDELAKGVDSGKLKGTVRVVEDDRGTTNFIYGRASQLPPINPNDKGHYHPESAEYWLVMSGQIRYPIEGQGVIIAGEGDVVYVPKFTFHAPRWYGEGASCRLAFNGYPQIAHLFEAKRVE
jgi:mannose-6-phosphate isomerase-like protein (cupin superfamily)